MATRDGHRAVTFTSVEQTYFRRGFGLKGRITGALTADYHSRLVDLVRERGYALTVGDLTFKLAREFGFCYGVDRAVEYAYETRAQFPDRRLFLVGEIIHNPDRKSTRLNSSHLVISYAVFCL